MSIPEQPRAKRARATASEGEGQHTVLAGSTVVDFHRATISVLCKRLEFLAALFASDGIDVMVNVCRCQNRLLTPESCADAFVVLSEEAGVHIPPMIDTATTAHDSSPADVPLTTLIRAMLTGLITAKAYKIALGDEVYGADHLDAYGSLDPEAINQTLARMFKRKMVHSTGSPAMMVPPHLLRCFKLPLLRVDENDVRQNQKNVDFAS